jgi:hypothetical protein
MWQEYFNYVAGIISVMCKKMTKGTREKAWDY